MGIRAIVVLLHRNSTVARRVTMIRTERRSTYGLFRAMTPKLGQYLKTIKLTRVELFFEEKVWIFTYDSQENNTTITQIQLVLVAAP